MKLFAALVIFVVLASVPARSVQVGPAPDGSVVVPTKQIIRPAGESVEFKGRPVDLVLSPGGKIVYVKTERAVVAIDAASWRILHKAGLSGAGGSMHGIAITRDGSTLYVTTSSNLLLEAKTAADGSITWVRKIGLPTPEGKKLNLVLCGIALSGDEKTAYVCLSVSNSLAVVDLESGRLTNEIAVGVAPFDVALSPDGATAYVSNLGGRRANKGEVTAKSAGTKVLVDQRGVASSGTLSIVDLKQEREITQIETGLHPSDVVVSADGYKVYVANANSDTVSVVDTRTREVVETIAVRPDADLPFGSAPNALALGKDGKTLYVANGGNNAVAVVALGAGLKSEAGLGYASGQNPAPKYSPSVVKGFIPTAWYPGAVATDGRNLYIANIKGWGSRFRRPDAKGWEIHAPLGTVTRVEIPSAAVLEKYTAQVKADSRVPQALLAMERQATGKKPVPVPDKLGEPSVFEHVVYIIKENKTYDQVFGDIGKGNSDPSLCVFGRECSPNHHALAEQFVLLDNYYCNGVCSADGHAWVTQGDATSYLEKSFGGWPRSYPFGGDDCLAICSSGAIWDNVLANGLSFRNYGEMTLTFLPPKTSWKDCYQDYLEGKRTVQWTNNINIEPLRRYGCKDYPGWNLKIPDVLRAEIFLRELREYEKRGDWPSFVTVYLPVDHTSGGAQNYPTPRAQMADNDLALGRIVEAISNSKFWPKTCIFVEEDDPQSGFDHVDGHRSICLVISPYTRRGQIISEFYSQTSVLHTMEQILGIPPMNQMDAMAPLMTACFTMEPDFTPYTCLQNTIPLDEMPGKTGLNYGDGSCFAKAGDSDPFAGPDRIDDDKLNRAIWALTKGSDVPYPAHLAGAHGTGLAPLHLRLNPDLDD